MKDIIHRIPIRGSCLFNESLLSHTTFRIGGPAKFFCEPEDLEDLKTLLHFASDNGIDISVIGNGSNLLVSDEGVNGIVFRLNRPYFSEYIRNKSVNGDGSGSIEAGAGVSVSRLLNFLQISGMSGLEQLAGLPATLGGAIAMNAQGIGKYVESICGISLDGNMHIIDRDSLIFGYRFFKTDVENLIITSATLRLKRQNPRFIKERMDEFLSYRNKTQELKLPSAGCVFKNPDGTKAGELIEKAGLKGRRIGNAEVSLRHANFIVNLGSATASDVLELIELTKDTIRKKFHILLEPEIKIVGI